MTNAQAREMYARRIALKAVKEIKRETAEVVGELVYEVTEKCALDPKEERKLYLLSLKKTYEGLL